MQAQKRFLKFRYAAIKRYGEKRWTASIGWIEFNPNYTVGTSRDETGLFGDDQNVAYVFELSNGTKFLALLNLPILGEDAVLSEGGEAANWAADDSAEKDVALYIDKYNQIKNTFNR